MEDPLIISCGLVLHIMQVYPWTQLRQLSVTVRNGDTLQCEGICKRVAIKLGGHQFTVDFHLLPIYGAYTLLGGAILVRLLPVIASFYPFGRNTYLARYSAYSRITTYVHQSIQASPSHRISSSYLPTGNSTNAYLIQQALQTYCPLCLTGCMWNVATSSKLHTSGDS